MPAKGFDSSTALHPPRSDESQLGGARAFLLLTLVASVGLLVCSGGLAYARSHPASSLGEALFWIGLLLIVGPFTARMATLGPARWERLASLLVVGVLLYLVKVVHDPYAFVYSDEWVHFNNAQEIARTGALFHPNPIIPVTARYPGLEAVTATLASTSGLSLFASGLLLLGAARIVLILALFFLFERLTGSARIAGAAGLVYATNPNFIFWSAQFSYESLALALAALSLVAAVAMPAAGGEPQQDGPVNLGSRLATTARLADERVGWGIAASLAAVATVVTHHISSWALCIALLSACVVASLRRSTRRDAPWLVAGVAVTATILWEYEVAPSTGSYLLPVLRRGFQQTIDTLRGRSSGRGLFESTVGASHEQVAPYWQRGIAIAAVGLIVLALPFGWRQITRRYTANPWVITLGIAAALYVAMLPMRLVPAAWETSNRSSEFLFVGVALTIGLAASRRWWTSRWFSPLAAVYIAVLLVGGVVAGWPPRVLLSQPYRAQVGNAVIGTQPSAAASWAADVLGPNHRFAAPEAVGRELLVHGDQTAFVTSAPFDIRGIVFGNVITSGMVSTLADRRIRYVATDRRASGDDSMGGYFFGGAGNTAVVNPRAAQKYNGFFGVDRIFDSGDIVVYDVGRLTGVQG